MLLLLASLAQDVEAAARTIETGSAAVYGLEHSSVRDLEVRVKGRWGKLDLADLNRGVYWLNTASAPRRAWSSGRATRGLGAEERAARACLDRVVWSFLSNRADDQALAELRRTEGPRAELKKEEGRWRVGWTGRDGQSEFFAGFSEAGRLLRAGGVMATYEGAERIEAVPWVDDYRYEKADGGARLAAVRMEAGELTAEWEAVGGAALPARIRGTLKEIGEVEIDLSERAVNQGKAAAAQRAQGR